MQKPALVRIPVVVGDLCEEVLTLLRECGHEPVLVQGTASALAAAGGMDTPPVVVTNHTSDRGTLIRELREAGAWVIGAAAEADVDQLAEADDLLPLPASAAALRARLRVAGGAPLRNQTLARMLVADRLLSVGTLASGVAHEINNPLAVTMANLEFALDELYGKERAPDLVEMAQALREALEGARRVGGIVKELRTFARTSNGEMRKPVSVATIVERALVLAASEIKHRARVVRDLSAVPKVEADEQQLGQIIVNLLTNAAQAIPEGSATGNEIRVRTAVEGGRVMIEVKDTGVGIPRENLRRIFDPFFTTKPPGQGTGLGLTVCHNLVTAIGGEIGIESTPGQGTTVRVLLPPAKDIDDGDATLPPSQAATRRARILVVDDERLLVRTVERVLASDHDVVTETDARNALERIAAGERFDLILCDLSMPEMSGMDLHAELGLLAPDQQARMLFLTGGAFTPAAQTFLESLTQPWLGKPFEAATLKAAIASRLS